jgi:hypothetical protein
MPLAVCRAVHRIILCSLPAALHAHASSLPLGPPSRQAGPVDVEVMLALGATGHGRGFAFRTQTAGASLTLAKPLGNKRFLHFQEPPFPGRGSVVLCGSARVPAKWPPRIGGGGSLSANSARGQQSEKYPPAQAIPFHFAIL